MPVLQPLAHRGDACADASRVTRLRGGEVNCSVLPYWTCKAPHSAVRHASRGDER